MNWPEITQELVRHLQALIRLDTTNLPGNEIIAAEYLARVLRAEGIQPSVLESAPGRGNVIARLTGTGELPPLLLYCHTDVVPAEPQHWTHPPFGGEIHDGFVWGRGAVDMKGAVAQQLMVMLLLKREGVPLRRDVIFAAAADEEIGGPEGYGLAWLVKHHPDLIRAEFGLTELGGYTLDMAGTQVYPIQVAEKGTVWMTLRARGQPGHASQPHADNAVVHLARAIERLAAHGLPYHLTDATASFLEAVSAAAEAELRATLQALKSDAGARQMFAGPLKGHPLEASLNALLHNTATPTGLRAGQETNVIPSTAEATLDGRTLPGFDTEAFIAEIAAVIGPGYEYEPFNVSPPIQTPHTTPLFELMARTLRRYDPQAPVVPHIMSGATDAKYLAKLGVPSYGFMPMKLPPGFNFMSLFHAHDERAPVEGLGWGLRVLYDVVREYCAYAR
jgi:acetylornithine deacetylase/succinyl-diaminopimelate desuccinylase-like protein